MRVSNSDLRGWVGVGRATLAVVFTDVIASTALRETYKDEHMGELFSSHFTKIRNLISEHNGFLVKTTGDGVLAVFRTAGHALDFARELLKDAESTILKVRVGIHVGAVDVGEVDVTGIEVHTAARLLSKIKGPEIWLTDRAKADIDALGATHQRNLTWLRHPRMRLRGLSQKAFTLWSVVEGEIAPEKFEPPTKTSTSQSRFSNRPAIAVLPFNNLSPLPDQNHITDGIVENIIDELASCRMFPVIARNSSFAFKDKALAITEIGRRLGAHYVMEGSFNRTQERVRISVRLVDATTGIQMVSERFDQAFERFVEIQDEITEMIVGSLAPELARAERLRVNQKTTLKPSSYEYFLRGQEAHYRYTRTDNAIAQNHLNKAIEADSGNAQAYALLAHAIIHAVQLGWRRDERHNYVVADQHAKNAIALDPRAPFAHFAYGATSMFLGRIDQALHEMRETVKINPSHAGAHAIMCHLLCYVEQPQEALKSVEWALRLSPYDPRLGLWLAGQSQAYYFQENYEKAAEVGREALLLIAENPIAQRFTAASLGQLGLIVEAADLIETLRRSPSPSISSIRDAVRHLYRDGRMIDHMLDGLRKAQLPETD
ncbi:MAG: adenylate/guanylate cyclase domain-containing protein [Stellaceae bacterium]